MCYYNELEPKEILPDYVDSQDGAPPVAVEQEWNQNTEWIEYIESFNTVIKKLASKHCSDLDMRQDCFQEAKMALLYIFPEKLSFYKLWCTGEILDSVWQSRLRAYCRQAAKYTILSFLDSSKKGNWYVGRTRRVKDVNTGKRRKVHRVARFSSLNQLLDFGMQISEEGEIHWARISDDGLYLEDSDRY